MNMQMLKRPGKPSLAYCYTPPGEKGRGLPLVFFCGGFRSDMAGTKATFLEGQCRERGQAFLRFDYSGHGRSEGRFEDGMIGAWLGDALGVLDHVTEEQALHDVLLVGSSMGGWIGLLTLFARPEKIRAMIGLAAAPDFTEDLYSKHLTEEQRARLTKEGRVEVPSLYEGEKPYILTAAFFEEAKNHFLLGRKNIAEVPVTLIQGMQDAEVPWEMTARIQKALSGQEVDVVLIEDGDHRLSRPEDLELIDREVRNLSALQEP